MVHFSIYKAKKNPYLLFLFKLLLFTFLVFCLDFIIGSLLRYFYFKQESGLQYRTTYSVEKTRADILVFGSSRANHHYHPDVFESRLNQSFYNTGRDGNYIFYHYAVLKCVLKRYTPQVVILDFVWGEFKPGQDSYDRLSSLLPYYETHPEIRPVIELRSRYEKLKLLSKIYPYNSSIFTIAVGNTEFNKERSNDNKGYIPLRRMASKVIPVSSRAPVYEVDMNKLNAFKSFVQDCIRANVKLYVVCSPYLMRSNQEDYSVLLAKKISKENHVPFLDYSNDATFYKNPNLFADNAHLNDSGARVFSNVLAEEIDKSIHTGRQAHLLQTSIDNSQSDWGAALLRHKYLISY